jgi:glycosyltransferase involved in cell wall biosynthesis/putative flippase GtrA
MGTDDRFLDLKSDPLPHEHRGGVSASTVVPGRGITASPSLSLPDLGTDFIDQPPAPRPPWPRGHEQPKPAPGELAPIHKRQSLLSLRVVRFGMVTMSCALLQFLILGFLNHLSVNPVLANGIGLVVSAQVNFALSALFTWRDRKPRLASHTKSPKATIAGVWVARWAKFNIIALGALAINQVVFVIALHAGVKLIAGSAAGILSGAIVMFSLNHFITFRNSARETTGLEIAERRPGLAYLRAKVPEEGVAFVLPAFNEAHNLRILVPKLVYYLYTLSCPFSVIIVDDGSAADDTYEVAERMSDSYASYVHVVHHPENLGYGAAIQTGLRSALGTEHGLIAFCDADNQFDTESFGTLLAALQDANADVAVGYRIDRADPPKRRIMGSLWHWLSTHMLDLGGVCDVDCGFKVFTRQVLIDVVPRLHGAYATVSPEILARSIAAGYNIVEAGVIHRPRTHGRQTGSDLKVVIRSLVRLFELRRALRKEQALKSERLNDRELAVPEIIPVSDPHRDRVAWLVGFMAAVISVAAYVITNHLDAVVLYKDSISHLEIARSVLDSTSPGLAQLGAVWLPLPHLVMLSLVWNDTLYHNGFAGSLPSMIAFVVMAVLMYRLVKDLTGHKFAGIVASAVLVSNVNMLYMQSTPMTEALLYCFITAMVLFVQRWAATGRYQYLVLAGLASLLGTLTRYESWPIFACLILTVILIARQRNARMAPRIRRASVLDYSIVYIAIGGLGIGAWIVWNWAILKNPLYFQDGQFGKPSLWVASTDPVVGNWWLSFKTYWYAMADTVTWPLLVIASVGLAAFFLVEWRTKAGAMRSLPALSLLIIFPFFVTCLYSGQRPIGVTQVQHYFSNVRFGLMMLMPTAVFVGYLPIAIGRLLRSKLAMYIAGSSLVALALLLNWALVSGHDVVTYSEPLSYHQTGGTANQDEVVGFLKHNYTSGRVLMESYGNEFIAFAIPSNQLVYEGSYLQWLPALRNPAQSRIEWIIMSCPKDNADIVCSTVSRPQLSAYVLAYRTRDGVYLVYRRRM